MQCYNVMESTAMTAGQQSPKLQHLREGSPARYPCLHCQHLDKVLEGVDPGSTPSGNSGALHVLELLWVVLPLPPGAQSLFQAVT